ncbi:TetR/AcrR family transcriptional regulator [Alteribacter keqinensis]|uniref:TetR/AcrR family transcriptional regulator n=1 Tax=Alteribacter keqinensis TaxID=2483800 RepID=A0A3M7TWF3_9BACI|nr:TetR/AcrR family transcriptional regulator [Alteribacter keqinensis]RNA69947.1 TetR/AcrR family transcriptional regulator [Alteribacter keqinensis]
MSPRGFHENEKKQIKEALIQAGRNHFGSNGLKKTNIKDLTKDAGIAQGSFYTFFESKELLYFRIMELDEEELKEKVAEAFLSEGDMHAEQFARILLYIFSLLDNYPLIRRLFLTDEYEQLVRKLPADVLAEHAHNDAMSLSPLLASLQEEGKLDPSLDHQVVSGVVRALFLTLAHKKEIGLEIFENCLVFMTEAVADRIFRNGKKSHD